MIHFNVPPFVGKETEYIQEAIKNHKICGDGPFTLRCNKWLEDNFLATKALLTTSGSAALDMAAILCDIKPGDEVILPSYTFSSTANAFVLAGAKLVFVDIRPDTMNIDENLIEPAITNRTKAICVVHYAGISCEMDKIMSIARNYNIKVIEDAAQAVMSTYKGKYLGTIGDFGCYSFHETKNYSMGEGGALIINNPDYIERAEILREKGTNRSQFYRGQVAKYNWVDFGDSYLPSDLNAAYLLAQLEVADEINRDRLSTWKKYYDYFSQLLFRDLMTLPFVPNGCVHNAHMFYIKTCSLEIRQKYIEYMKNNDILCPFHYVPLHSSPAGIKFGIFHGEDINTSAESDKLVRLPLYYGMKEEDVEKVISKTTEFFIPN
ncbi:dTDP-4-amino-4,6-dideoxygalactose transaminase [Succinivibrio faecicola]|uniref:dTDP-4-amino-4,6-dideoxygalactose transaminase n=1 Tax=Succinivibrio faecicola TaxID=2820300 RepID=A0ABS7DII6_9GAMM|nr:dTDP-4-amino-4,6-dideoxygalactose transaminase [Succinivibrio faecicola]MBW7571106.1 dTDP-4-amino-4,6-dideoxygalactose transaminase [Succinivibrio faecicola]